MPPSAGSYPSSLSHYEAILGRLPLARTSARILLVLQDPRSDEKSFKVADPTKATNTLGPTEHHYFCLTPVAWRSLKLDIATRSPNPRWPTPETAQFFLRRYLSKTGSWSYDGFLAYFLYLMKPEAAVITNLAKCHFGPDQTRRVYKRCASVHLKMEASLLQPNLLVSFGSQCDQEILNDCVPSLRAVARLNLLHPAARVSHMVKRQRLLDEVKRESKALQRLGFDLPTLITQWEQDTKWVLAP